MADDALGEVVAIDLASGRKRRLFRRPRRPECDSDILAFSPDGRTLATGGADTTALTWDVSRFRREPSAPAAGRLEDLWDRLAGEAGPAHRAAVALSRRSDAVPFLSDRVRPVPAFDAAAARRWVAQLDDDDQDRREAATRELRDLGKDAEAVLREARANSSPEVRRRVARLLREAEGMPLPRPALLRNLRAIEALECAEARDALARLAKTLPPGREADEVAGALARLGR